MGYLAGTHMASTISLYARTQGHLAVGTMHNQVLSWYTQIESANGQKCIGKEFRLGKSKDQTSWMGLKTQKQPRNADCGWTGYGFQDSWLTLDYAHDIQARSSTHERGEDMVGGNCCCASCCLQQ